MHQFLARFILALLLAVPALAFPIHRPEYNGVEQVIVLNNQWVIVVIDDIDDVIEALNQQTRGKYLEMAEMWIKSLATPRYSWGARKAMDTLIQDNLAKARERAGERRLDSRSSYKITSLDDPSYSHPQSPFEVTRYVAMLGKAKTDALHAINYAHYCYIELPQPMRTGLSYKVTVGNRSVEFLYDEMKTVSRAIKVNQVGYLDSAQDKVAYLGAYLHELGAIGFADIEEFHIIDEKSGQTVFTGSPRLRTTAFTKPPPGKRLSNTPAYMSGEDVYELDFSDLKQTGRFFISIPGVGRSWSFAHGPDVYGEVFYHTARALYHQRCGIAIEKPYSPWPRQLCHQEPVYECDHIARLPLVAHPKDYAVFDVIARTIDYTKPHEHTQGGWHDAADWDRRAAHLTCVFDLQYAYELAPEKFADGQLNIPESGNGIPDILDEAEYGLRVWRLSQDERGGVSSAVETWTHPKIDDPDIHYAFGQRTRCTSLLYAAAAAQYAKVVAPFSPELSKTYRQSALRAFAFGMNPDHSLGKTKLKARHQRGQGDDYEIDFEDLTEEQLAAYKVFAQLRLFILTEDDEYLKTIEELLETSISPFKHPMASTCSHWFYFGLFNKKVREKLPTELVRKWEGTYIDELAGLARLSREQPYGQTWPIDRDFWMRWGATCFYNQSRSLLIAHQMTKMDGFKEVALRNCNFMLGSNPMGMSWTTGLGACYPVDIQHHVSEMDGIADPIPGISIFGLTGEVNHQLAQLVWNSPDKELGQVAFMTPANSNLPVWHRWACHPHINTAQCEFTVHETISASIFTSAMLLPDGWMPSEELKQRQPKERAELYGYWYLP